MKSFNDFIEYIWNDSRILDTHTAKAHKQLQQIFLELTHTPSVVLNLSDNSAINNSLAKMGCDVSCRSDELSTGSGFDTLLAFDEYFTWAESESAQFEIVKKSVANILPNGIMLASVRDYRNNPYHKRTVGDTTSLLVSGKQHVIVETHTSVPMDKQAWNQTNFVLTDSSDSELFDVGRRRTLYFKQFAKYCNDLGCQHYGILKDHFWKSPWHRQPEYIAWARF